MILTQGILLSPPAKAGSVAFECCRRSFLSAGKWLRCQPSCHRFLTTASPESLTFEHHICCKWFFHLHVLPTPCITWLRLKITNARIAVPVPCLKYLMIHTQYHLALSCRETQQKCGKSVREYSFQIAISFDSGGLTDAESDPGPRLLPIAAPGNPKQTLNVLHPERHIGTCLYRIRTN